MSQYIDIKNFYYTNCDSEKTFLKYKKSSCLNAKYISENIIIYNSGAIQNYIAGPVSQDIIFNAVFT